MLCINESVNQSINQLVSQSVHQAINQSISQPVSPPIQRSLDQHVSTSVYQCQVHTVLSRYLSEVPLVAVSVSITAYVDVRQQIAVSDPCQCSVLSKTCAPLPIVPGLLLAVKEGVTHYGPHFPATTLWQKSQADLWRMTKLFEQSLWHSAGEHRLHTKQAVLLLVVCSVTAAAAASA